LRIDDPAQIRRLLADKTPTLLLLSKFVDTDRLESELKLDDRSDDRFVFEHRAFRLRGIDMEPLLSPRLTSGTTCPYLELRDLGGNPLALTNSEFFMSPGGFVVHVTPPLREDGWLAVRLTRPADEPNGPDRFDACVGGRLLAWEKMNPSAQKYKITVPIKHGRWSSGPTDVVIYLHAGQSSAGSPAVVAHVTEVSLSLFPEAAVSP
ncbi:MAG: hypothetical protein JWL69_969, partial [Phycisphaerales bacterium]|nr:hypothetical protein [Phycisphaerales bacterium]